MLEHHKTRATLSGGQGPPPCGSLFPSPRGVGTPWRWVDIARGGPPAEETGKAIVGSQELRWGVLGIRAMIYSVSARLIDGKFSQFLEELTDGTIARQQPDGTGIVQSMERARVGPDGIARWSETCYCPTTPPVAHIT